MLLALLICLFICRIVSEFAPPPEGQLKPGFLQLNDKTEQNVKDAGHGRGRGRGRGRFDESRFVQMNSVFSEVPMMAQAHVNNSRLHYGKFSNIVSDFQLYIL